MLGIGIPTLGKPLGSCTPTDAFGPPLCWPPCCPPDWPPDWEPPELPPELPPEFEPLWPPPLWPPPLWPPPLWPPDDEDWEPLLD